MENQKLDYTERKIIADFFNQGGYVFDFSTLDFDDFTNESIGIPLCETYKLSKGKSLLAYVKEAPLADVAKLLSDLIRYYEISDFKNENRYAYLAEKYSQCKAVIDKLKGLHVEVLGAEKIKECFNSDYITAQINMMVTMQDENPTEAIGKAKELVESCCKTILENESIEIGKEWDMPRLVDETFKLFKIMPKNISDDVKGAKSIKQVLGSLKGVAQGMAELRNLYGSGHGKSESYTGLEPRHAYLAVGSCITLVRFLWDSYERHCFIKENQHG